MYVLTVLVFAFEKAGADGVAVAALVRSLLAALAAPFTSALADRIGFLLIVGLVGAQAGMAHAGRRRDCLQRDGRLTAQATTFRRSR
jgi:hypothetical protein